MQIGSNLKRVEDSLKLTQIVDTLEALRRQATNWVERAVEDMNMSGSDDSQVQPILPTSKDLEPFGSTVVAQEKKAPPPSLPREQPEPISTKLNLAPAELVRLAPRLESCLVTDQPNWNDVADAAAVLSNHLGIPRSLYGEACRTLGRAPAAVAIAVISTKPPGYFHTSGPGGYLRGMLKRAECGQLFLDRSVFGLRDSAGYRRKQYAAGGGNWRPS
jgi:replication initiation protein RepC